MKKIRHYLGVRSVRLSALAVLVATFVGLPALGHAIGTSAFDKLDAVNYLSSVLLAEEMPPAGGSYTPPPSTSTYTAPTTTSTYTAPTTGTYTAPTTGTTGTYPTGTTGAYPTGTTGTYPTGTTGAYPTGTTGTYPTGTTGAYPTGTTGTYPTGTTGAYPTGTTGTYPTGTTGAYPTGTTGTTSSYQPGTGCSTPETCASMSSGTFKSSDFVCTSGACSMTAAAQATSQTMMQNTQSQPQSSCAPGTNCTSTSTNTNTQYQSQMMPQTTPAYMPGEMSTQYTDYSSREQKYGDFSQYFTQAQYDPNACSGSNCGGMTQYGFQNYTPDAGFSFNYQYTGAQYTAPVGSQVTQQQTQLTSQLTQNADVAKDWTRFSSTTGRLADKFTQAASAVSMRGGNNTTLTNMLSGVASIDSDVTGTMNEINTYYNSLKSATSNLSSTSTAGDVASVKTGTQLLQTYNTLGQAMDVRVQAAKQAEGLADMYTQIANVKAQYKTGMPSGVQKKIDAVQSQADKLAGYISQANDQYTSIASDISTIRSYTDPTQISTALAGTYDLGNEVSNFSDKMDSDFQKFWESNPLATLNQASTGAQMQQMQGSLSTQIGEMKQGITQAKTGLASIKSLNLGKSSGTFATALSALTSSADKMTSVMGKMETALTSAGGELSSENTSKFFDIQNSMMSSVGTNMKVVTDYLNANKSAWSNSPDAASIKEFIAQDMSGQDQANANYSQSFDDIYSDSASTAGVDIEALKAQIRSEVMAELTQQISASLMAEVAKYIGDDKAGEILSNFMNKTAIFGEAGATALQATTDVLGVIEIIPTGGDVVVTEGTETEVEDLQTVIDEVKVAVVSDDTSMDMQDALGTAADLLSTGASQDELIAVTDQINELLEKNESNLTENGLQFNDMTLANDSEAWYFDSVMTLKQDGVVKGKEEGNYDPSGEVTYAEVAKMAMEASGEGKATGVPSDSSAVGQWYQGYVKSVEQNAPDFAAHVTGDASIDWNDPCPREWVAVLIGQAYDLPEADYTGKFKDVSESNPNAGYVQTVFDYGVMKGDSTGGTYRPSEGINRAEVATVIYRADQSVGEAQNIDSTLESADSDLDAILEELGADVSSDKSSSDSEETTVQKILSFLGNLKAMLPFLN